MYQLNIEKVIQYINDGYISKRQHPILPIFVLNYTHKATQDHVWENETLLCRGIVVDNAYNILSTSLPKFFTYEQITTLKNKQSFVYEQFQQINQLPPPTHYVKLDGSLINVFYHNDRWIACSRGSFTSEQAIHAQNLVDTKYKNAFNQVSKEYTYVFELIYPANRIVVDYGTTDDIILLAVIKDWVDVADIHTYSCLFNIVHKVGDIDYLRAASLNKDNEEGYVAIFTNGLRLKIKFANYLAKHKLIFGFKHPEKIVWENLMSGNQPPLADLPIDLQNICIHWIEHYTQRFKEIDIITNQILQQHEGFTRKDFGIHYGASEYSSVIFAKLDNKNWQSKVWMLLKPNL